MLVSNYGDGKVIEESRNWQLGGGIRFLSVKNARVSVRDFWSRVEIVEPLSEVSEDPLECESEDCVCVWVACPGPLQHLHRSGPSALPICG